MSAVASTTTLPAAVFSSESCINKQAKLKLNLARATRKNHDIEGVRTASHQVTSFLSNLGGRLETLIDNSPFGVPDPEPWSPETDKTAAALNDPIAALTEGVTEICEGLPGVNAAQIFDSDGAAATTFAAWASASQSLLMSVRRGLENAVEAEKKLNLGSDDDKLVMVDAADADTTVPKQGGADAFVDLGADKWGNSTRRSNPWDESVSEAKVIQKQVKKALSDFTMNKFLPFVDNLTLRANGIIVTSDDCSVECSVASLVDTVSDGECPSIATEGALEEFEDAVETTKIIQEEHQVVIAPEEIEIKIDCTKTEENAEGNVVTDDEDEDDFVMADQDTESDEEDFVDILDEDFDVTSVN